MAAQSLTISSLPLITSYVTYQFTNRSNLVKFYRATCVTPEPSAHDELMGITTTHWTIGGGWVVDAVDGLTITLRNGTRTRTMEAVARHGGRVVLRETGIAG